MVKEITYRLATAQDADMLSRLRYDQLIDEGETPAEDVHPQTVEYFIKGIESGTDIVWLAEAGGKAVATCGVKLCDFAPGFTNPTGGYAYIHSVYTCPAYRGRGLAKTLVRKCVQGAANKGYKKAFLYASPQGAPVYVKAGFQRDEAFMSNWQ